MALLLGKVAFAHADSECPERGDRAAKTGIRFDVVGHLVHGEKTYRMPRVRLILRDGERTPFDPFDRYAMYEASRGKSIDQLLDEFAELLAANLVELASLNLTDQQLSLPGQHPRMGKVTLRQLLAAWVVHDLNHLHRIAKCMAIQYRADVGPWDFTGVYA